MSVLTARAKRGTKAILRALGWELHRYQKENDEFERLVRAFIERNVDVVLDVGANIGQFAESLRRHGYRRSIVSFEPLSSAHATLEERAKADPHWIVARRCAVGASPGSIEINVSANSVSSSILAMLESHVAGAPESAYVGREPVDVITMDQYLADNVTLQGRRLGLKADVQGYEDNVIEGARESMKRVWVLYLEMSLIPLYEGGASFLSLYAKLDALGYRCISIAPGFTDAKTFEVLQVNAIFARDG